MSIAHTTRGCYLLAHSLLSITLIFATACSRSSGSTPLTPEQFTKEVVGALQARIPPDVSVTVSKDLEITMATKAYPKMVCDLGKAYTDYQQNPVQKADIIERWVAYNVELAKSKPASIDTSRIVPLVRNRAYLKNTADALREHGMNGDADFVRDDLNDDLIVLYAQTTDTSLHFLHPSDLQDAGIDRKNLRKLACANLSKIVRRVLSSGGKGINIFMTGTDFGASLLLLDNFLNKDQMHVKGDIVVGVPDGDCLIVTGSDDPECLQAARKAVAENYAKASRPISDKLFVLRNGHFNEFPEAPAASAQPK